MGKFKACFIPPNIDIAFLRYLTKGAEELRARMTAERKEICAARNGTHEELKDWEIQEAAAVIIPQIPARAEIEAKSPNGKNYAIVMEVPSEEFEHLRKHPDSVTGVTKLVYDFCAAEGLKPTFESFVRREEGQRFIKEGLYLVIHW